MLQSESICFKCVCSQERCEGAIISLGTEEIDQLIADKQDIVMNCEFCHQRYTIDQVDLSKLRKIAEQKVTNS